MRVKKLVPVLMFVMAVVTSFAFRSVENSKAVRHECVWFIYKSTAAQTLVAARTPSNWEFSATEPECGNPGNRLCAICVPEDEVYANGSGTADDTPKVDDSITPSDAYTELGNAFTAGPPIVWTPVTHPNGTLIHIKTKI